MEKKEKKQRTAKGRQPIQQSKFQKIPDDIQQLILSFVGNFQNALDAALVLTVATGSRQEQIQILLSEYTEYVARSGDQLEWLLAFLATHPLKSRVRKIEVELKQLALEMDEDDFDLVTSFEQLHRFALTNISVNWGNELKRLPTQKLNQIIFSRIDHQVSQFKAREGVFWRLLGSTTKRPTLKMLEWTTIDEVHEMARLRAIPKSTDLFTWMDKVPNLQHLNLACHWREEQFDDKQNLLMCIAVNCPQIKTILLQNDLTDEELEDIDFDAGLWMLREVVIQTVFTTCKQLERLAVAERQLKFEVGWTKTVAENSWKLDLGMGWVGAIRLCNFQLACVLGTGILAWNDIEANDTDANTIQDWIGYLQQLSEHKGLHVETWRAGGKELIQKLASSEQAKTLFHQFLNNLKVQELVADFGYYGVARFLMDQKYCEVNNMPTEHFRTTLSLLPKQTFSRVFLQEVFDPALASLLFSKTLRRVSIIVTNLNRHPTELLKRLVATCQGVGVLEEILIRLGSPEVEPRRRIDLSQADWTTVIQCCLDLNDVKKFPALTDFRAIFFNSTEADVLDAKANLPSVFEMAQNKTSWIFDFDGIFVKDGLPPHPTSVQTFQAFMERNPRIQEVTFPYDVWIQAEQLEVIVQQHKSSFPFQSRELKYLAVSFEQSYVLLDDLILLKKQCPNLHKMDLTYVGREYPTIKQKQTLPQNMRLASPDELKLLPSDWDFSYGVQVYVLSSQPVQVLQSAMETSGPTIGKNLTESLVKAIAEWKNFDQWCDIRDQQDLEATLHRWEAPDFDSKRDAKLLVRAMQMHRPLELLNGRLKFDGQLFKLDNSLSNPTVESLLQKLA